MSDKDKADRPAREETGVSTNTIIMTDDEKADMIAKKNGNQHICEYCWTSYDSTSDCYTSAMEMAEWKQQQMIEKAVNWLKENEAKYWSSEYDTPQRLLDDFKEAMEE